MAEEKRKTEKQYQRAIVDKCKKVGTYKIESLETIKRLAKLYVQADKLTDQFEQSGGNAVIMYTNKAGATNYIKNPLFTARTDVYNQLLEYERELGLTPAAMKKLAILKQKTKESPLIAALKELSTG